MFPAFGLLRKLWQPGLVEQSMRWRFGASGTFRFLTGEASVFGRDLERLCGAPRIDRNSNTVVHRPDLVDWDKFEGRKRTFRA